MENFIVIPAIDIKGGRCVRLAQGRPGDETVYSDDPVRTAQHWVAQGARMLHVVDLDGAFGGEPAHTETILEIAAAAGVPVQVGGGIRTRSDADRLLENGVSRVIIGTGAFDSPDALNEWAAAYGGRLAVGIDARNSRVRIKGWTEEAGEDAAGLAGRASAAGVKTIIYTDISLDGMLRGPNFKAIAAVCRAVECRVIASGGVSSAGDIAGLRGLGCPNLAGAIVGKALYENITGLPELIKAAENGAQKPNQNNKGKTSCF